jgi:hypothetical protein
LLNYDQSPFGAIHANGKLDSRAASEHAALAGAALFRETRGKEGTRETPPFPVSNDLAAVLALKAKPSGRAPRGPDRSGPPRKTHLDIRERGLWSGVHVRAQRAAIRAHRNFMHMNQISRKTDANAQQSFMFHYTSLLPIPAARAETSRQDSETAAQLGRR